MSINAFLSESTDAISRTAKSLVPKFVDNCHRVFVRGNEFMHALDRKRKFKFGLFLVLWPVLVAAAFPAEYSNRWPLAVFCAAALLSEGAAIFLFFQSYDRSIDRPEDRLTPWSVIGAAAAGACTLAFLIAAVVNVLRIW